MFERQNRMLVHQQVIEVMRQDGDKNKDEEEGNGFFDPFVIRIFAEIFAHAQFFLKPVMETDEDENRQGAEAVYEHGQHDVFHFFPIEQAVKVGKFFQAHPNEYKGKQFELFDHRMGYRYGNRKNKAENFDHQQESKSDFYGHEGVFKKLPKTGGGQYAFMNGKTQDQGCEKHVSQKAADKGMGGPPVPKRGNAIVEAGEKIVKFVMPGIHTAKVAIFCGVSC